MKTLYLSSDQARQLAEDLKEYSGMRDSCARVMFSGFKIAFGDTLAEGVQAEQDLTVTPIPEFIEIQGET